MGILGPLPKIKQKFLFAFWLLKCNLSGILIDLFFLLIILRFARIWCSFFLTKSFFVFFLFIQISCMQDLNSSFSLLFKKKLLFLFYFFGAKTTLAEFFSKNRRFSNSNIGSHTKMQKICSTDR